GDDALVPEDLRVAYRILKNAGYVPPEVQALNHIAELERYIARDDLDADAVSKGVRKLALLKARVEATYFRKMVAKLAR
ncbi:MAG: DnaJ family domain-containing protein, partial [Burkholderiales bacterium]